MDILNLITILCILIPGTYWAVLDIKYGLYRKLNIRELFINIALFNFVIALLLSGIYWFFDWDFSYFEFLDDSENFKRSELRDEIAISSSIAFIFSKIWLLISNYDLIHTALYKLKLTKRTQKEDIWRTAHNYGKPEFEYCDFYDKQYELVYKGNILAYSETSGFREVLFLDAEVYDFKGNFITRAPYIYVSCPEDQVRMEFYKKGENQND